MGDSGAPLDPNNQFGVVQDKVSQGGLLATSPPDLKPPPPDIITPRPLEDLNLCLQVLSYLCLQVRIGFQFVPPGPKWKNANFVLEVRIGFQFVPPSPK